MEVALTDIKYSSEGYVEAGTDISETDLEETLGEDGMDQLRESGAIGEPVLSGSQAEDLVKVQMQEVDRLLQEKYNLTLAEVMEENPDVAKPTPTAEEGAEPQTWDEGTGLATEGTTGESEEVTPPEDSPDGA